MKIRKIVSQVNSNREYKILVFKEKYPLYADDGVMFYPKVRRGYKNTNKRLTRYQMRAFRSWKHNRKTQFKNGVTCTKAGRL